MPAHGAEELAVGLQRKQQRARLRSKPFDDEHHRHEHQQP
jgi:hypothetical protein